MEGGNVEEVVDVVGVAGVAGNGSGEFALVGVCWGRETVIVSLATKSINGTATTRTAFCCLTVDGQVWVPTQIVVSPILCKVADLPEVSSLVAVVFLAPSAMTPTRTTRRGR